MENHIAFFLRSFPCLAMDSQMAFSSLNCADGPAKRFLNSGLDCITFFALKVKIEYLN